ncbi:MAG: hemerythrin domain-containing protein [Phycisphaerales bacterium]|nr:MAG: hemerythrin domain-containing protein [Phycisphaerales bacterium]
MGTERPSFDKVVEEHRELRDMIEKFRGFLGERQPDIGDEQLHGWAASLARQLETLHDKLFLHFQEEEQVGVLEELAEQFPRAISAIKRLEDEHGQILGEVRNTVTASKILAEGKPPSGPDLRDRAVSLLDQLAQHERVETDLMERLHCEDLGTGD